MKVKKAVNVIDAHTAGHPIRIVTNIHNVLGGSMVEKKHYLKINMDWIRKITMQEPRGYRDMFGAVITSPTSSKADIGVVFMGPSDYYDMCVHGSIGIVTVAVETGMVSQTEPITKVTLDTPAGLVTAYARVKDEKVEEVTIRGVPSFLFKSVDVNIPEVGRIPVDIAYGGNYYAIVDSEKLGVKVDKSYYEKLVKLGISVRKAVNKQVKIYHPERLDVNEVHGVRINEETGKPNVVRNVVIFGESGLLAREPCGTGTCAYMATLYTKGRIKLNEVLMNESITATRYKAKIVEEVKVGEFKAIVAEVTGSSYITGYCTFTVDPSDPLKEGYLLY